MRVKKITKTKARVYDLTVESDHNYIANGQVVHNCLKDVSRVLEVPLSEVNQVTKSIIERSSGDERASQTIADSFKDFDVCRKFDKKYPKVLYHAKSLEGLAKNPGIHAAGVVASPVPLTDLLPLEVRKAESGGESVIVTATDMYNVAAVGLVKIDVLGLRTLTVIKECLEAIEENTGEKLDLEADDFDLNDPETLQGFTDHKYDGIFQYDTPSADKICMGIKFTDFEDIPAMTALNRPGTARSGLATKYIQRKKNPKLAAKVDFHPKVSAITSDTLGIIVYQEHVIRIFTDIAGFAPGTADSLRKTIAKKIGDETLGKERVKFVEGAAKHAGVDEKTANKIMDAITFFGSYGFNKTICKNAWVWKPGANSHSKSQIQIGELVRLRDSRDEKGRLTPIAKKIRGGRLHLLQMDEDGRVRPARLIGIHDHGIRETFVIETESGNKTPAISRMHRLMTSRGYKSIATGLSVGDELMFMGENTAKDYCPWWINKDTRFAQADRINDKYKLKVEQVWIESDSICSNCGTICRQGRGGGEVAHIKSPAECDYNHAAFHSKANLRLLCNSCHKKLDYEKGERTKRWGKGRPTFADKIIKITPNGKEHCYDLEMDSVGHNFVAGHSPDSPPVVSHNSHATEYGLIGYWTMWLKIHYPLEFYWALLKNEPDRIRIQRLAKAAKKNYGIELKPPHINVSREQFSMDPGDRSIRGSLIDIKGVGAAASKAIIAEQPYKDFIDFVSRVDKKKCHKGVVMALTKAGALENMIPSVKWMVDNLESIWSLVTKKKYADVIDTMEKAKGAEEYGKEDLCLISAEVNPLALGTHPIEAYRDFIETNIKLPIVSMSDEDFFADYGNTSCFVAAVIVEVKYNQIGDFHTGALPTERERKEMFWGARYANVNLEDPGGKQYRTKFDIDVFDEYRAIIDKGLGTPVVACVTPNAKYENLKAHFAVNIESLRSKLQSGESLNIWESIVVGKHPALSYEWKNDKIRDIRTTNCKFHKSKDGGFYTGIVTNVRKKYDKNGNEMAFLGVLAADGKLIEIISFASTWRSIGKHISIGKLIAIEVEKKSDRRRSTSYFCGTALKIYNYK